MSKATLQVILDLEGAMGFTDRANRREGLTEQERKIILAVDEALDDAIEELKGI